MKGKERLTSMTLRKLDRYFGGCTKATSSRNRSVVKEGPAWRRTQAFLAVRRPPKQLRMLSFMSPDLIVVFINEIAA